MPATLETYASRLAKTLPELRERIARAAERAGRSPGEVRLIAVTKAHPVEAVEAALEAGLTDLGENRVEELASKVERLGRGTATWHMIGHLQSRKAGLASELADLIHSVDSPRLGERLARMGQERDAPISVLAQVNTSGEESKSGFQGPDVLERVHELSELPGLRVRGLMTMAPFVDDEDVLTAAFASLRELSGRLRGLGDGVGPELSMGMTNDLEIAIREGSTMVRIGTALFGDRPK